MECGGEDGGVDGFCAGLFEGFGTFVQGGPTGGDIVDQQYRFIRKRMALSDGEGAFDVAAALGGAEVPLLLRMANANQVGRNMRICWSDLSGQQIRLVVAAAESSAPMQRHGHDHFNVTVKQGC